MQNDYGLNDAQIAYDRQEPSKEEPKIYCDFCHAPIFEGECFYEIDNGRMCESCLENIRRYA